jgi:hypothetical protein
MTSVEPVAVMNTSPAGAASAIGSTRKPRSTASRARTGSTSVTTTLAPSARADSAMPAPHAPKPATTMTLPAMSAPLARSSPSITDCAVPCALSTILVTGVSLAATTGKASFPSAAIRRSRSTPVVVPSHPPRTPARNCGRSVCSVDTRSPPSSMTRSGPDSAASNAASMWS